MDIVTIDFETYYDTDYSLSKMTNEAYIRDPRFEVVGVSVKVNDHPSDWYSGTDPGRFLRSLDYRDKAVLAHHTHFDGAILSWMYGIRPKLWLDTLSMARPLYGMTTSLALGSLAKVLGVGTKGDEVIRAKGKRRADFAPDELARYGEYSCMDADLTFDIFQKLRKSFPLSELRVIDMVIRMYTEPSFELDEYALQKHLADIRAAKQAFYAKLGGEAKARKHLMSNEKFATVLRKLGVEPPTKISKTTGKTTYAFAKTDQAFLDLQGHHDPRVSFLVDARLNTKSTLEETRTASFIGVSQRGPLPIYLNYYGAHTGRLSGGDRLNLQNLPRGGALRKAMVAPEGYTVVSCDSAQIEARIVAWLAEQEDLVEAFRQGRDVYSEFATDVYNFPVSKANKQERHVGKTAILGLGYSMGGVRFQATLATGNPRVSMGLGQCKNIVRLYRNKNHKIYGLWDRCSYALGQMVLGNSGTLARNLSFDGSKIKLPSGLHINYPGLSQVNNEYVYANRPKAYADVVKAKLLGQPTDTDKLIRIYGGKVTENVVQALARVVVIDQMVQIRARFPTALQVHDEIVSVVPTERAEDCRDYMLRVMSQPPKWAPDLPVSCEAGVGPSFGDAK
jgi:DNA polymerase I-like protein with 3'-5' exonuclease and polymerase domains